MPSLTFPLSNLPGKDQVHQRSFNENVAEEAGDHAEDKIESEQVEHGQIRQEQSLIQRRNQCCVNDRENKVDQVAQAGEGHPEVTRECAFEHVAMIERHEYHQCHDCHNEEGPAQTYEQ